ncbi:hypothetical protein BH11MYX4_BH11MYX4_53820 [soil metagenome]
MALSDTSAAAARVQLELLRKCGCERRAQLTRSMSRSVIDLSRAALRERMPEASERDVLLRWVALQYGSDLAERVRRYVPAPKGDE